MKADAFVLTKLYDTLNKAYVIPNYQRPFAWDPSKAVELLDAILEDAKASAKLTSIGTFLFCNVPIAVGNHPFGNNAPNSDAPNTLWEVVDGQQRLTVLALLGYALKERLTTLTAAGLTYSPPLEFDQLFRTSRKMNGKTVPVLVRDEDNFDGGLKSDLAHLLNAFAGNEPMPPNIGDRLKGALIAVKEWVETNLDAGAFPGFCDYFLSQCQCVQVEADDQDTAFMMFEPLNSTSEPLTAFEVFRSQVVRNLQPPPAFPKTVELLDYDNSRRDDVVKRSNDLIFTSAQVISGERPKKHFLQLKKYLDGHVNAPFVDRLEKGAEFFKTFWNDQTLVAAWFGDEARGCVRFLKAASHDAPLPLLLRYYQTHPSQVADVVKAVVAFFALWRSAFPTNKLPEVYRGLLTSGSPTNMAVDGGTLMSVVNLKSYFRAKLEARLGAPAPGLSHRDLWVDDSRLVNLSYDELATVCRLFIFLDIGASIKSNLVPDDPWTQKDDIEHILAAGTPANNSLNRIGNLTFLPPTINRSIQGMVWADKREVYGLLSATQRANVLPTAFPDGRPLPDAVREYLAAPNSPALVHLDALRLNATWSQTEIDTRTKSMLGRIWDLLYTGWLH